MKAYLFTTFTLLLVVLFALPTASAQNWRNIEGDIASGNHSIFRPLADWPDANDYRSASGAPGARYWQQRADYVIEAEIDTVNHVMTGSERITYHNNSPDELGFLWVQLDQNVRSLEHSRSYQMQGALPENISPGFRRFVGVGQFDGGYEITRVQLVDDAGRLVDTSFRIRDTIMRVNLAEPLAAGSSMSFDIDWSYRIPDSGRGGKEMVRDGWLYEMAQWFPRMSG